MQVQHSGTGFIAVDSLLDLLVHGDWNVFREVTDLELRAIGSHSDDQFFLVFGVQRTVNEIHGYLRGRIVGLSVFCQSTGRNF
ncbi:hypothetical protein D3C81_1420320 [compost metagenome]